MTGFDFTIEKIVIYILASAIGYIYFRYGKSMSDFKFMASGAGFFLYSYFFDSMWALISVGIVLGIVPFYSRLLNWLHGKFS